MKIHGKIISIEEQDDRREQSGTLTCSSLNKFGIYSIEELRNINEKFEHVYTVSSQVKEYNARYQNTLKDDSKISSPISIQVSLNHRAPMRNATTVVENQDKPKLKPNNKKAAYKAQHNPDKIPPPYASENELDEYKRRKNKDTTPRKPSPLRPK